MTMVFDAQTYINRIENGERLTKEEFLDLLNALNGESYDWLFERANAVRKAHFGNAVYIRGLIEFTNYCKCDCLYCGLRRSNLFADRYRLSSDEIISCCDTGYSLGFRTFVLQGGEDGYFNVERMTSIIRAIKTRFPDCALTLSLGEKDESDYKAYRDAGADRYLLRHETANPEHYKKLHPHGVTLDTRIQCLETLKRLGFQVGAGFMVGSPFQTMYDIACDLFFLQEFRPHMVGIGPFIPHKDTPFGKYAPGSVDMTLKLLAIVRIMLPDVLLPATTALNSLDSDGRVRGVRVGANVIMPNLSPASCRKKYMLYDGKAISGEESAQELLKLKQSMKKAGFEIVVDRGDSPLKSII